MPRPIRWYCNLSYDVQSTIKHGVTLWTLLKTRNKVSLREPLPPVTYAPHTTQPWLKPMTQEYMPASRTSLPVHTLKSKSYPEAKRSRSCSCCEKKESESACVRESLRFIIIVAVYQTIREKATTRSLKALVRRASTTSSTRYTVSSVPLPHAHLFRTIISDTVHTHICIYI